MRELTQEELKQVELEILKDVARFCDKNDIRYYLGGGTLLGAVRHQGFIPWDDDIDISMPRPDYLKFLALYNQSTDEYKVDAIEINPQYWRTFAKVFDQRTWLQEDNIRGKKKGNAVFIDVFPIDGIPDSKWKQFLLYKEQEFLNFLYHGSAWTFTKSHKYDDLAVRYSKLKTIIRTALKFIAVTLLRPLPTQKLIWLINLNAQRTSYEESKYIGAIVDCAHGAACERIEKKIFEPRMEFLFEGKYFWGPKGYDIYLKNLYGDYMVLPPMKNRVTHHDFKAFWKESIRNSKGTANNGYNEAKGNQSTC